MKTQYEIRKDMIYGTWSTRALAALRDDLSRMIAERAGETKTPFHREPGGCNICPTCHHPVLLRVNELGQCEDCARKEKCAVCGKRACLPIDVDKPYEAMLPIGWGLHKIPPERKSLYVFEPVCEAHPELHEKFT